MSPWRVSLAPSPKDVLSSAPRAPAPAPARARGARARRRAALAERAAALLHARVRIRLRTTRFATFYIILFQLLLMNHTYFLHLFSIINFEIRKQDNILHYKSSIFPFS